MNTRGSGLAFRIGAGAVGLIALLLVVRATVAQVYTVPTSVVAPEVPVGARILVYKLGLPQSGDIVAFRQGEATWLGRVDHFEPDGSLVLSRSAGPMTITPDQVIGRVVATTR